MKRRVPYILKSWERATFELIQKHKIQVLELRDYILLRYVLQKIFFLHLIYFILLIIYFEEIKLCVTTEHKTMNADILVQKGPIGYKKSLKQSKFH